MNITTVGLDLAKNVFQVHGIDKDGKVIVCKAVVTGRQQNNRQCESNSPL